MVRLGDAEEIDVHVCACLLSHVRLFVTPWTVDHWAPLSMGVSR